MTLQELERKKFGERLLDLLGNQGYSSSPTDVAREFNARFAGEAVTVYAVRKWLLGEAIPTQEKMVVIAKWLGASVQWLRFGEPGPSASENPSKHNASHVLSAAEKRILSELRQLGDHDREMAYEFVSMLFLMTMEK